METNPSSSSSSSSSPPAKKFDVFLSFRGEDTRNNFTGHLSLALRKIGLFNIFRDDYALEKGKDIGPELMAAIEDSQYAVVVLSENYATSSWCLKELTKIVECMGDSGRIRTIFYHVNPTHVRNVISLDVKKQQESSFWKALVSSDVKKQQESSFWKALKEHAKNPSHSEYLESWRNALVKVANQSGYPVEAHTDEAIFIKDFFEKISHELGASIRTIENLFGMISRLKKLDSDVLQSLDTHTVCFLGIHGMGGIGKSTLARAYYKRMSHKFDGCCFLQNIREVFEKKANGLVDLQKQLLSDILKHKFEEIGHVDDGIDMIRSRLCRKKVLIVLDDVSEEEQLTALAEEDSWFGSGSIIIVTTREDTFLKIRSYKIYGVENLNPRDALQLFSWKAFRSIEPPKEYQKLSEQVIEYAGYLPLALTVLGSLLGGKNTSEWESALQRLMKCPEKAIVEKLKISFDDLNKTDQRIFLDIACFFKGRGEDYVIKIMDSCSFDPIIGIRNLINKSLLSIQYGKLWMHDLLEEMGKEIVRKESDNTPGRQSRIWDAVDLYHILENEEGTNEVEAIVAFPDEESIVSGFPDKETMEFKYEALSCMKNLRLLMISSSCMECDEPKLKYLSNNLQYLEWRGFSDNKLPSSFQPLKLVRLKLLESSIEQLWNNCVKPLCNLKVIDLTESAYFTKFEDFQVVPNLEKLILKDCVRLSEIHPSIKHLEKLILLDLGGCTSLEKLPEEINGLASLQTLNLIDCHNLEKLPDSLGQLTSLRELRIERYGIKHLPSSVNLIEMLESLNCDITEMIRLGVREEIRSYETTGKCFLPDWFSTEPESPYLLLLTELDLCNCNLSGPEAFPEYFGKLVHLEILDLSYNPFSVLPSLIKGLTRLVILNLSNCVSLRCLEAELLPSSLKVVYVNYCTSLVSFLDPSKPCHLRCSSVSCLDCTELVKRQDAKMTALAALSRFLENRSNRRNKEFRFLIPGSDNELPSWFRDQSSTASVCVKFDPNRLNSKLIGFAVVFCFCAGYSGFQVRYCKIGVSGGKEWETERVDMGFFGNTVSDHLFLLYTTWEDTLKHIKNPKSGSCDTLEFSFLRAYDEDKDCSSCGPCGVRLVYEEDIEELKQITAQYHNY